MMIQIHNAEELVWAFYQGSLDKYALVKCNTKRTTAMWAVFGRHFTLSFDIGRAEIASLIENCTDHDDDVWDPTWSPRARHAPLVLEHIRELDVPLAKTYFNSDIALVIKPLA